MTSFLSLLAVLLATSVGAELVNINDQVDQLLERENDKTRMIRQSTFTFKNQQVFGNVTFTNGVIVGQDSRIRTGDCTVSVEGNTVTTDIHTGFSLMGFAFQDLTVNRDEMSAFLRISDNSFQSTYTIHNDNKCYVTLDNYKAERLEKADLAASRPKYDGKDVSDFLKASVLPKYNDYMEKLRPLIEKRLQSLCSHPQDPLSVIPNVALQIFY